MYTLVPKSEYLKIHSIIRDISGSDTLYYTVDNNFRLLNNEQKSNFYIFVLNV